MTVIVVALILVLLLLWYMNQMSAEKYLQFPELLHTWTDGSNYIMHASNRVYERFDLTPIASKLRDAGLELSNTLQRRLGDINAGSTENMTRDQAFGTIWQGRYNNITLPV